MELIKRNFYYIWGGVYLPPKLLNNPEKKILHISDTPTIFYGALFRMIKKLKPQYIIHTGDLADNIKLELKPNKKNEYAQAVFSLLNILENSPAEKIFITLGNHDNFSIASQMANRSIIIENTEVISIEDTSFKISHYAENIMDSTCQFNLFGHDIIYNNYKKPGSIFLNGIKNINVITLDKKEIFYLPYPLGTNDSRLGKFKIGI
ncbi:MAG: metallophosphoesterase [Bacillota bacterium]